MSTAVVRRAMVVVRRPGLALLVSGGGRGGCSAKLLPQPRIVLLDGHELLDQEFAISLLRLELVLQARVFLTKRLCVRQSRWAQKPEREIWTR